MAEQRLIDAEALKRSIIKQLVDSKKSKRHGVLEIVGECIDYAPTVEAKPVVHAHWEYMGKNEYCDSIFACTNCNYDMGTTQGYAPSENIKYCPYCGATMDERKGEKE